METLYDFIESLCREYKIDASHDLQHSIRCVAWVNRLADADPAFTVDERRMAIYAVALHDMCDAKYTDVYVASRRVRTWLCTNGWTEELADAIIHIITTMSYSKLRAAMVDAEIVYPDHGRWQAVYHIVRHADLLEAYRVDRCYLYQKHVRPDMSDDECWNNVAALFQRRVLKYVSDGWIFLDAALEHTDRLEAEARRRIATRELE
jgi:HD superfamily phosphodiesterase